MEEVLKDDPFSKFVVFSAYPVGDPPLLHAIPPPFFACYPPLCIHFPLHLYALPSYIILSLSFTL